MEQHSSTVESRNSTEYSVFKKSLRTLQRLVIAVNGVVLLPPILFELGAEKVAKYLYMALGLVCHQRADRSFYLFGESFMYAKDVVQQRVPYDQLFTFDFQHRFTCGDGLGCKLGVCARCTGMYLGLLIGLLVSELLIQLKIPKFLFILLLVPLALDGIVQTVAYILAPERGFYESTNPRRFLTGLFFGFGVGYFVVSAIKPEIAKK